MDLMSYREMSWPGNGCNTLEDLGTLLAVVRVVHEVYRMNGDMIYGTHIMHMGSP